MRCPALGMLAIFRRQSVCHAPQLQSSLATTTARRSVSGAATEKVGVLMLNMGGPSSLDGAVDGVEPFLRRLFSDRDIIKLGPLQDWLGPYIAKRRAPRIIAQYARIGGKSPIGRWTHEQGAAMQRWLAPASEGAARHAFRASDVAGAAAVARSSGALVSQQGSGRSFTLYTAFRYAPPLTDEALLRMAADGVTRAVAFSQYPQYSCTTTGSSLNHLWRECRRLGLERQFTWSVIDRWYAHPTFIAAVARRVALGLASWPAEERHRVVLLFSAHSVPMMTVNKGDPYTSEIAATVHLVMQHLQRHGAETGAEEGAAAGGSGVLPASNPHTLAWQSKVGFLPWMGPPTGQVIAGLGAQGHRDVLVVPIAFTSDHVETLFEIDIEYAELAHKAGIANFRRVPALNDEPLLALAQAQVVAEHLERGTAAEGHAYSLPCAGCVNPECRAIVNPAHPYAPRRALAPAP